MFASFNEGGRFHLLYYGEVSSLASRRATKIVPSTVNFPYSEHHLQR